MVGFHLICAFLICTRVFSSGVEVTQKQEQISDGDGHVFTLNVTNKESEEDIDVHDTNGNHIITVEMMGDEGYNIDKPANESVCLLSKLEEVATIEGDPDSNETENNGKPLCYDRVPYTESNISEQLQDHCAGRDMFVLVPRNCSGDEANAVETDESDEDGGRVKRGWLRYRCYFRYYYTIRYIRYRYCCAWCCRRTCYVYRFAWVRVYYYRCGFYG